MEQLYPRCLLWGESVPYYIYLSANNFLGSIYIYIVGFITLKSVFHYFYLFSLKIVHNDYILK